MHLEPFEIFKATNDVRGKEQEITFACAPYGDKIIISNIATINMLMITCGNFKSLFLAP